jgi:hypothetical protein
MRIGEAVERAPLTALREDDFDFPGTSCFSARAAPIVRAGVRNAVKLYVVTTAVYPAAMQAIARVTLIVAVLTRGRAFRA